MRKDTLKITMGGLIVAIFGMLLVFNRQTGMMFQELIFYVLPIPMVAYSAKWGFKTSIPVLIAMGLISLILGDVTTIFYAVSEAIVGLVLGARIYHKADMTKTMLLVIAISIVACLLNTVVFASLFGINPAQEVEEARNMMIETYRTTYQTAGLDSTEVIAQLEKILSKQTMMVCFMVSMILLGAIQGILVYYISLMILKRLHIQIPTPKPLSEVCPPVWTALLSGAAVLAYLILYSRLENEIWGLMVQTAGMCGMCYLLFFGFVGIVFWVRMLTGGKKLPGIVFAIVGMIMFTHIELLAGVVYIIYRRIEIRERSAE